MEQIEEMIKAAEHADARTQYRIGMMYLTGEGVDQNQDVAYYWLLKSAKQGDAEAQYEVGMLLLNDRFVKVNSGLLTMESTTESPVFKAFPCRMNEMVSAKREEAFEWMRKAAKQGLPKAEYMVGYMYAVALGVRYDEKKAFGWYCKAAKHGFLEAQYRVAVRYEEGTGTDVNVFRSLWWYLKATQRGQKEAVYRMAKVYDRRGRKADASKVWHLYQQAAELGGVEAMVHIGQLYEAGMFVEQDFKKAYEWFRKALDAGYKKAYYSLGNLYYQGKGVERNLGKAFECYMFAAKNYNVPEAQYALGCMYEKGEVVKQNMQQAIRWYEAAAKSGNHDAEAALERLKPNWKKYFRILGK